MAELCRLASAGEHDAAKALDDSLQELNSALFVESNPIPVKWAVAQLGLIEPHIRLFLNLYTSPASCMFETVGDGLLTVVL